MKQKERSVKENENEARNVCYQIGLDHGRDKNLADITTQAIDSLSCLSKEDREAYAKGFNEGYEKRTGMKV